MKGGVLHTDSATSGSAPQFVAIKTPAPSQSRKRTPLQKDATFQLFLCVCPEPVLAANLRLFKYFLKNGIAKKAFSAPRENDQPCPNFLQLRSCVPDVAADVRDEQRRDYQKTRLFVSFPLCLSRVCLGKMIVYSIKWHRKKTRFLPDCNGVTIRSTAEQKKNAWTTCSVLVDAKGSVLD